MGEGEGSGGGDGGARGALSPVGGSKGPEPLASPNVIHWVGWLPFTTRCGTGPAVPASHGARNGKAIERCRRQGRSTGRSGLRPSAPAGQVAGPVIHEPTATLEQVRAPVGRLDLAAYPVRQGSLSHFARVIGLFGRPVPEARPEAVRHRRDLQLPEQLRQRRGHGRLAPPARKHQRTAAADCPRLLQDLQGTTAQRDPVIAIPKRPSPWCAGPGWSRRPGRGPSPSRPPRKPHRSVPPSGPGTRMDA